MNDKDIELIIYNQLVTELKNHGITTGVKAGFFPENHISGEDFIAFILLVRHRQDGRNAVMPSAGRMPIIPKAR